MIAMVELSRWIYLAALRLTDLCVDRFPGPLAQAVTSARFRRGVVRLQSRER